MSITIRRHGRAYVLEAETRLPRPLEAVFAFFADARNLDYLTPARLRFEILTPHPIVMQRGAQIDYRLRFYAIPLRWQSEITVWEPPHRFVDEQRRGPYRWWIHEHRFRAEADETVVSDRVEYAVPGGAFVHWLLVARDLRAIFRYRAAKLYEFFSAPAVAAPRCTDT
jgi:ligand-binding SRPBCC domain-containing protein